jgi:hypothetical protein
MKNLPVSSGATSLYRELISAAAAADGITSISTRKFITAAAVMMGSNFLTVEAFVGRDGTTRDRCRQLSSFDAEKIQN